MADEFAIELQALVDAAEKIDELVRYSPRKWVQQSEDFEGTLTFILEFEFSGSGEQASEIGRRFVSEWLVHQPQEVRHALDILPRFV